MRYNFLNEVHLPVRLTLLNASVQLNADENVDPFVIVSKVSNLMHVLRQQFTNEEQFILPLVFDYEPCVWDHFIRQHHQLKNEISEIEQMLKTFSACTDTEAQWLIASLVNYHFQQTVLSNFRHMDEEEEVLTEILWRYYSDGTLQSTYRQMQMLPTLAPRKQEPKFIATAHAA